MHIWLRLCGYCSSSKAKCLHKAPASNYISSEITELLPGENFEADKQCELEFGSGFRLCPFKDQVDIGTRGRQIRIFPVLAHLCRSLVHLQLSLRLQVQPAAVGRRHVLRERQVVPPRGVHPAGQADDDARGRRMGVLATVSICTTFQEIYT